MRIDEFETTRNSSLAAIKSLVDDYDGLRCKRLESIIDALDADEPSIDQLRELENVGNAIMKYADDLPQKMSKQRAVYASMILEPLAGNELEKKGMVSRYFQVKARSYTRERKNGPSKISRLNELMSAIEGDERYSTQYDNLQTLKDGVIAILNLTPPTNEQLHALMHGTEYFDEIDRIFKESQH